MNPDDRFERTHRAGDALASLFASLAEVQVNRGRIAAAAPAAMMRLAEATYGHDNGQAQIVAACLASIYNGADARPVRLDQIRGLDWELQQDLIIVMLGTGHGEFPDTAIREAFEEVGGPAAVDWFHWYTTGGPHRAALTRIVTHIAANPTSATASALRATIQSLYNRRTPVDLRFFEDGEYGEDLALVVDGVIGRDRGVIGSTDIETAFEKANIPAALAQEAWPA